MLSLKLPFSDFIQTAKYFVLFGTHSILLCVLSGTMEYTEMSEIDRRARLMQLMSIDGDTGVESCSVCHISYQGKAVEGLGTI